MHPGLFVDARADGVQYEKTCSPVTDQGRRQSAGVFRSREPSPVLNAGPNSL